MMYFWIPLALANAALCRPRKPRRAWLPKRAGRARTRALNFASSLGASHAHLGWRGYVAEIAALSAARP
jgi:hypothetical protein